MTLGVAFTVRPCFNRGMTTTRTARPPLSEFAFETNGHDVYHTEGGYTVWNVTGWVGSCRTRNEAEHLAWSE